jgi:DNA-damage-inducible protein D
MGKDLSTQVFEDFESIKKIEGELEYWSARDLMKILDYEVWRNFIPVIERAIEACIKSGNVIEHHFVRADRKFVIGSTAERSLEDYMLTRFACYLIAQNGDPRKPVIAAAQNYFAVQTRLQELGALKELEDRRLEARHKLRDTESTLESTVYTRGIHTSVEFASFKNKHVEALYGGISVKTLKARRNIPEKRALADFDTDVELKAKDFALAMTDHNIKEKNLRGRPILEDEVVSNSKAARKALIERGIVPEHLKPEEDLKVIEQRRKREHKLAEKQEQKKLGE